MLTELGVVASESVEDVAEPLDPAPLLPDPPFPALLLLLLLDPLTVFEPLLPCPLEPLLPCPLEPLLFVGCAPPLVPAEVPVEPGHRPACRWSL